MLKMVDGTGIIGVDMVCPLGGAVSPPQPPNYDKVEMEGMGSLTLQNSLKAPLERLELIGNSTQGENPAPDNPQEIKSAGRKSKNLFDAKKAKSGWITSDGKQTLATLGSIDNVISDYIQVYPGMNYTSSASVYQNFYDSEKNFLNHNPNASTSIVVPDNAKYMIVVVGVNRALAIQTANTLMINIGSSALPYEQYTDKYLLDVKVTGKNLLSNKPTDWMIGKTTSWGAVPQTPVSYGTNVKNGIATINVKSSTNYSFINKNTNKLWVYRIIEQDENGLGYVNHPFYKDESLNYKKCNFSTRSNTSNIVFEIKKVDGTELLSSDIESIKIMLVEGEVNEPTPYEPYAEQFMQIVLNEPLRGIGEYKDTITKDGVVRKIYPPYEINLNDLRDGGYEKTNTVMFSVKVQNKTVGYANLKPSILCNILPDCALQMVNIYNSDKECIAVGVGIILFRVNKSRLKDISSFESTKQSFIELMADKKLIVEYVLAEPVIEPLPESVQAQLSALHSENGTTHVFVDSGEVPCGIKLTYRKEK